MPLIMGPLGDRATESRLAYPQVETLAFQYLTDPEAIRALLPECYQPGDPPLVTVLYSESNGLAFMAGAGYRLAAFQVAARFDGEQDHVEGDLILVMFENQTWPILGGREDLGVPKLFADISPFRRMPGGRVKCQASLHGRLLFGLETRPLRARGGVARIVAGRRINARPWLGYKYIPSLDGPPDAAYPTITVNDTKIGKLWLAQSADLQFGAAGAEDLPYVRTLLDALATLSVKSPVQVVRFTGSAVLRYDLSRRLR
jgi:acetoacetate decarboxylase